MFAFRMTPEIGEEFWKRVIERQANTEKERFEILMQMAEEGLLISVSKTTRSKEEYKKALAKEFRILDVTTENKSEDK